MNYFQNPFFGGMNYQQPYYGYQQNYGGFFQPQPINGTAQPYVNFENVGYQEQSYIENILRLNKGKTATIYMNFENSQWGSKIFKGVIEAAGKDHIILSDSSGIRYLLLTIYLNYITFDEEINYFYPYQDR